MLFIIRLLLYTELLWSAVLTCFAFRYVHINPAHGEDSVDCYWPNSASMPCSSLDWALKNRSDGTHYLLSAGTHLLNGPVDTFEFLSDIGFIGEGGSPNATVILCSTDKSGLAFHNVDGITWANVTVYNCSSPRLSTSKNFHTFEENNTYKVYQFLVAIYFNLCANVSFDHVIVENTPNGTGVVMYNTFGTNTIQNSLFLNNSRTAINNNPGGGGVYIEFTYCVVGDENCFENNDKIKSYFSNNTKSAYEFNHCTFSHNTANSSDSGPANSTYIVPFRADHVAFGRGGGLSIFLKGNASNNTFSITDCNFTDNSALWGGGLFIEFHDDTFENKVRVESTFFSNNFCNFGIESGTAGGGMRIGHYVYGLDPITGSGNQVFIDNCIFENNAAFDGGGLSISPTVENVHPNQVATVHINNTNFIGNYGRLGAALHIDRFVMIVEGYILKVFVQDCKFHNNSINYTEYIQINQLFNAFQTGAGSVYVNQVPISFISEAHFTQNIGSALAAVSTSVNFTNCIAQFSRNTGNNGGAIALLGGAFIMVNDHSSLTFKKNKAIQLGGAIYNRYIERQNLISYTNCFIRHIDFLIRPEDWNAKFYFHDNTDKGGSRNSAIYTTSILPCSRAGGSGVSISKETIFCWNILNWEYSPVPCMNQTFSDVGSIVFQTTNQTTNTQVKAFPGHKFTLPLTISDDLDTDIGDQTAFSTSFGPNKTSTYVWDRSITLPGEGNTSVSLQLDTVSERVWEVHVVVELQSCPPGFKLVNKACECAGHYIRAITCDIEKFQANISKNNWIGKVPSSQQYLVGFCPPYYCSSVPTPLPNTSIGIENVLCAENNRRGIVCGECEDGFGVAINSPSFKCVDCSGSLSRNIAAYIASVYIPLVVLFSAIILFNIRLTSGSANAFILYSQVIAGTFDLDSDGQISVSNTVGNVTARNLDNAYRVVYGIFNLQFVERFISPLCVGKLNTLDVLMAEYAVALSPLVMMIGVLIAFRLKECCSQRCRSRRKKRISEVPRFALAKQRRTIASAILPAFSAFLLLSYTKFSTVSAFILFSQRLFDENGQFAGPPRVYYAGQYEIGDPHYKKYMITAYVVYCTFVAIPPLLLLDFPRRIFEWAISRCDCLWRYYPADKVQILLDTFQGCYKNKMRFFAGLYFVFRLVINITYIFTHNWFDQYLIQQVACCVMVALLSICQPYNENYKIFNVVDVLVFTNLAVINALSNFLLSQSGALQPTVPPTPLIIQYILLYLPLVYMIFYLMWLLLSSKKRFFAKILLDIVHKFESSKYRPLQVFAANLKTDDGQEERTENRHSINEEEALLERAQERNMYRTFSRTEIRIENDDSGTASVRNISTNT